MFSKYALPTAYYTCIIIILLYSNSIVDLHLGGFFQHAHDKQPEKCK